MSDRERYNLMNRYAKLSEFGDPLERLNVVMDWKVFLPLINKAFRRQRKSQAGRKPYNRLMMFKILVLQGLYNLGDGQMEYQIRDRLSFIRFLGLDLSQEVPDEKTIWSYREVLTESGMLEKLFERFNRFLGRRGYAAELGSMIDASIVEVPKQRNSRDVNKKIKEGEIPECISKNPHCRSRKDIEARWAIKNGHAYYGYKDHINADTKYKLIRKYKVTPASTNDIHCFEELLDKRNNDNRVWADSAYYSQDSEKMLKENGYLSRLIRRNSCHFPEWSEQDRENTRRAKIRKRVEHIFGFMENSMNKMFIRTIGLARAKAKIGLMNLVYNICRFEQLERLGIG
jgi:IS5 family transposase